jgi:hypothetical protein
MELGWELAQHAARTLWFRSISKSITGRPYVPRAATPAGEPTSHELRLIESAGHPNALTALWRDLSARGLWTDEHTQAAAARKAQLVGSTPTL